MANFQYPEGSIAVRNGVKFQIAVPLGTQLVGAGTGGATSNGAPTTPSAGGGGLIMAPTSPLNRDELYRVGIIKRPIYSPDPAPNQFELEGGQTHAVIDQFEDTLPPNVVEVSPKEFAKATGTLKWYQRLEVQIAGGVVAAGTAIGLLALAFRKKRR